MKKILVAVCLVLFGFAILYLVFTVKFASWDFRNNLWAPAYLLVHKKSAYNIQPLFSDSNAIWFPQIVGVFFFLGFLPQYPASTFWLIFNVALLLGLIWYLIRKFDQKIKPLHLGILTACMFLFPPTIRHFVLGQADILLMMAFIGTVYAIEKRSLVLGGFLLAIALVKPQHGIVVLPVIFIYLLFMKKVPQEAARLFFTTCFFIILQTIPLWWSDPAWVRDFVSNLQRNPIWAQPGIFILLQNFFGKSGVILWFILYLMILGINLRIWSKNKPEKAILWSLASTSIISPYLWSWDFVLLLPLLADTVLCLSGISGKLTLFIFYALCFYGTVLALQGGTASDEVLWWLPFLLMTGIVLSIVMERIRDKNSLLEI